MADADTAAVAIATFAVLFGRLRQEMDREQVTATEMSDLLGRSLTALEDLGRSGMIDGARQLVEDTFRVLLAASPRSSPTSG